MPIGKKIEPFKPIDNNMSLHEKVGYKELLLVKILNISLCLDDSKCQKGDKNYDIQRTKIKYKIKYRNEKRAVGRIILKSENIRTELIPKYVLTAIIENVDSIHINDKVTYIFKRTIEGRESRFIRKVLTENNTIIYIPFKEGEISDKIGYKVSYKVIGKFLNGRTLESLSKNEITYIFALGESEGKNKKEKLYLDILILLIHIMQLYIKL